MITKRSVWMSTVITFAAVIVAVSFVFQSAHAQATNTVRKKVVSAGGYDALVSKAQAKGKVRILVKVNIPYEPERALMSGTAVQSQRAAIGNAQGKIVADLARQGLKPDKLHKYTFVPYLAMTVDRATLETLLASDEVAGIQEDVPVPPMEAGWDIERIGADTLQAKGITGNGVSVAVLDTGVDKNHPYLAGAVVSEACYSTTDAGHSCVSLCPGGASESTAIDSALPYGTGLCPAGECDHGTHVSGTVAGRNGVVGSPGPGVAPEAGIIAIQVFSLFNSEDYCGSGIDSCVLSWSSDQIKGLERVYALDGTYSIAAANMSLGGGAYSSAADCDASNSATKAAIDNLRGAGIATVISSGNEGMCRAMAAPGCISTAVSVGATDINDMVADYSNSASFLSLLAPGSGITSSIPGDSYETWNGTSMAAPHVSGAWALLKSAYPATVDEIFDALASTGKKVVDTKCSSVAKQRIDVDQAYTYFNSPKPAPVVAYLTPAFGTVGTLVNVSGVNFGAGQGLSTVTFNGVAAGVVSWSDRSIKCTVPLGASTGKVVVTTRGGSSNGRTFALMPPAIAKLSIPAGTVGTTVALTGAYFGPTQGTSFVTFNDVTATVVSWSDRIIKCTVPLGAATGKVVVTTPVGSSNGRTFALMPPAIAKLSIPAGTVGTTVALTGAYFGPTQGTSFVTFNDVAATVVSWSDRIIKCTVPSGTPGGKVVVTTPVGRSNGRTFSLLIPALVALSPAKGAVGTIVSISGANFGATQEAVSAVTFNGVAAGVASWSDKSIKCTVPAGATTGPVTVTTPGGTSNVRIFTVNP